MFQRQQQPQKRGHRRSLLFGMARTGCGGGGADDDHASTTRLAPSKLIRWQRITIGVLAGATLCSMWQAHLYQRARASDWQAIEQLRDRLADVYRSQRQKRLESRLEEQNRITSLELQVKADQEMIATLGKGTINETASRSARNFHDREDAQIIHDLDARLKKYEAKYGPIEPRQGEGADIGRNVTRGLTADLPSR